MDCSSRRPSPPEFSNTQTAQQGWVRRDTVCSKCVQSLFCQNTRRPLGRQGSIWKVVVVVWFLILNDKWCFYLKAWQSLSVLFLEISIRKSLFLVASSHSVHTFPTPVLSEHPDTLDHVLMREGRVQRSEPRTATRVLGRIGVFSDHARLSSQSDLYKFLYLANDHIEF